MGLDFLGVAPGSAPGAGWLPEHLREELPGHRQLLQHLGLRGGGKPAEKEWGGGVRGLGGGGAVMDVDLSREHESGLHPSLPPHHCM